MAKILVLVRWPAVRRCRERYISNDKRIRWANQDVLSSFWNNHVSAHRHPAGPQRPLLLRRRGGVQRFLGGWPRAGHSQVAAEQAHRSVGRAPWRAAPAANHPALRGDRGGRALLRALPRRA